MYNHHVINKGNTNKEDKTMKVYELTKMLTHETEITIKDSRTKETLWTGNASAATFSDAIKNWDFSKGHIIYIGR